MNRLPILLRNAASISLLLLLLACGSGNMQAGSQAGEVTPVPQGLDLPWPPPDTADRTASDDSIEVLGADFDAAGDGGHASSTVCKLNNGTAPWAIWSMSGFNVFELGSIKIDFQKLSGGETTLFIGLANYQENRWEWSSTLANGSFTVTPGNPSDYHSPTGNVHIALVRWGPATIDVQKLTFNRIGDGSLPAPTNLRSDEQTPENIGLQWDPVPGAASYNVYASRYPDLHEPLQLNAEPVLAPDFDYEPAIKGVIFYFYVTAVAATESDPSEFIDIFLPLLDMPAPLNPRVSESTPTSVTIAWDWDTELLGPEPAKGFYVYLKGEKDFNLDPLIEINYRSQGWARTAQFSNLDEGALYYFRICGAGLNNARGRMTDDLPAITGEYWDWTDANAIAPGSEPIAGLATGNEASLVWLDNGSVVFAQGSGSNWETGSCGLDAGEQNFKNYLDIDERDGNFLVGAFDFVDQDLYASFGDPLGGWTKEFVADGTKTGEFEVPSAGNHLNVAITDTSYAIIHKDWYAKMSYLHSRPVEGSGWSRTDVRALADAGFPIQLEMKSSGSDVAFLYFDYEIHELLFEEGPPPFTLDQISDNSGANNGLDTDLVMTPGGWVSTSYDASNEDLYLLRQNGSEWLLEDIAVSPSTSTGYGRNARLEPFRGTGLLAVFLNESDKWYTAVYDGSEWFQQVMLLPLVQPSTRAELVVVNDVPYFFLEDISNDLIYCVKGVIPPFGEL